MIKAMYTAAAGMTAQQTEVDVIANNLANVNTAGFKKSMTHFEDLLYLTLTQPGAAMRSGTGISGLQIGSGARLMGTTKTHTQGVIAQTGNFLDMAIQGDGFFEIEGPVGERFYTRDGHFTKDANGELVTAGGYRLIPSITVPQEATQISITKDGTVSYQLNDTNPQIGQVTLVRFVNPAGLSSEGGNLFRATAASGDPQTVIPGQEGAGQILQGAIERSNVDVANELIQLILAQRAFEVNSKAIKTSDEMLNTTNNLTR
ncbi:MAG: flagellar basal-body rod protein FlgG [Planctomycetes bacterium]|jgi:flagellar basal-body rod protein FlgG|nr:flagellar basal-body rod protein FlgG [Planctomycetota bacterium]